MSSSKPTATYFDKDVRPHFFDPVTRRAHFQLAFLQSSISEKVGCQSVSTWCCDPISGLENTRSLPSLLPVNEVVGKEGGAQ